MLPWLIFLALTASELILMTLWPSLNIFAAILWGATLIVAGVYLHRRNLIYLYGTNLVVLFFILGLESMMFFLLFFGSAGLIMSYLASRDKEYYFIQSRGVITAVLGVSVFLLIFYFGTGQNQISDREQELDGYMQEAIEEFSQSDLYQAYEAQGITLEEIRDGFHETVVIILKHLPALFYLQAIMAVFFMLFFAQMASRMLAVERLRKKAYPQEIMPWQLVWVFIAGLGLWLWGREETSAAYYIGSNILAVIAPIALYYGFAVTLYVLKRMPIKRNFGLIVLAVVFVTIFTVPIIIMLGLIGLFDALIDYRKIRWQKEG